MVGCLCQGPVHEAGQEVYVLQAGVSCLISLQVPGSQAGNTVVVATGLVKAAWEVAACGGGCDGPCNGICEPC